MSEFIFKETGEGLVYVGDFEGLYKNETDPWGQSGGDFHRDFRFNLIGLLRKYPVESILVVGCGLGYETCLIQQLVCNNTEGMDISQIAIEKARKLFPFIEFKVGDVRRQIDGKYEMIMLSSILWYILPDLAVVAEIIHEALEENGYFVITQAFIENQRYGKEIMDGFTGLVNWIKTLEKFQLLNIHYEKGKRYNVGTVILQRR